MFQTLEKRVRWSFPQSDTIRSYYGQALQDVMVLTLLNGKRFGSYLEIGASHPIEFNNTYLLSTDFNWRGLSIDIEPQYKVFWDELRPKDNLLIADALNINYENILTQYFPSKTIDYLQLDIDPNFNTLECLKILSMTNYRFKIITFETDCYVSPEVRDHSREILSNLGYFRMFGDVETYFGDKFVPYEDWWVDLNQVNKEIAFSVQHMTALVKNPKLIFLN